MSGRDAVRPTYATGQPVELKDHVLGTGNLAGCVVFIAETSEYTDDFFDSEWSYLQTGFMVKFEDGTLVLYQSGDNELALNRRGGQEEAQP